MRKGREEGEGWVWGARRGKMVFAADFFTRIPLINSKTH
jgi:hypothetical protein